MENNSSEPLITSMAELVSVNGAVGRATPNLTGAINESAVSHNSSTANLISAWKTFLHFIKGCEAWLVLKIQKIKISFSTCFR